MFEKVNPQHPDKVADRIAGAVHSEHPNAGTTSKKEIKYGNRTN